MMRITRQLPSVFNRFYFNRYVFFQGVYTMAFGRFRQSPRLSQVESNMRDIGKGTFLGSDTRRLAEILEQDRLQVEELGLSHQAIAERLDGITRIAKGHLGDKVILEDRYEVTVVEARGRIPCPWSHPKGLFPKSHVELRDTVGGETLVWTDLSVHLIREHGFYQGIGSPYRLEPARLRQILFPRDSRPD